MPLISLGLYRHPFCGPWLSVYVTFTVEVEVAVAMAFVVAVAVSVFVDTTTEGV